MRQGDLELDLLGRFAVRRHSGEVAVPRVAQRLLAQLALARRPLGRAAIAGLLWPDARGAQGKGRLRTVLWRLNRRGADGLVEGGEHLRLAPEVDVDLWRSWTYAEQVLAGHDAFRGDASLSALQLDVLPGWEEDWVAVEREHYRQIRLHALEAFSSRRLFDGHPGEAVVAALAAVSADPLRESAHHALIAAYLAEGNRGEAVRQYRVCHRLLMDALGLPPSARLVELIDPALAGP